MLVERTRTGQQGRHHDDISDLRDSSDRNGISVVVELKHHTQPRKVLNQLFKYTAPSNPLSA